MTGITSVLHEARLFAPPPAFSERANIQNMAQYHSLCAQAEANYEAYWAHQARRHIDWQQPFTVAFDASQAPFYQWFADGQLNLSHNCLDRHLPHRAKQTALIFERDDGTSERISYQTLYERVCRCANGLKSLGVGKGDRVAIYMPMVPDAIVAMQACARIDTFIFSGYPHLEEAYRVAELLFPLLDVAKTTIPAYEPGPARGEAVAHNLHGPSQALPS